jgi:hypothetical protein
MSLTFPCGRVCYKRLPVTFSRLWPVAAAVVWGHKQNDRNR